MENFYMSKLSEVEKEVYETCGREWELLASVEDSYLSEIVDDEGEVPAGIDARSPRYGVNLFMLIQAMVGVFEKYFPDIEDAGDIIIDAYGDDLIGLFELHGLEFEERLGDYFK
jgi:hypothetical protein